MEPTTDRQWRLVAIYQSDNPVPTNAHIGPIVYAETMADAIEIGWDLYATETNTCEPATMLAVPLRP